MATNDNRWAMTYIRRDWDAVVPTDSCPYCDGTGRADDNNECGFCEDLDTGWRLR